MSEAKYSLTCLARVKGKDACGGCVSGHTHMTTERNKEKYPMYKKIDVDSKQGQAFAKRYGVTRIPAFRKCRIKKDGTQGHCTIVQGWKKSQWT